MNPSKKLTRAALLTAASLIVFVIEAQIPPLTPVPGIKLGLSNVFSLAALYLLGPLCAFAVSAVRIVLGGFITGQAAAIMYSFAGAVPSLLFCILTCRLFKSHFWPMSCISAVIHNAGQLALAIIITQTAELYLYLPLLILSGIIAGAFTGICAEFVLKRIGRQSFKS